MVGAEEVITKVCYAGLPTKKARLRICTVLLCQERVLEVSLSRNPEALPSKSTLHRLIIGTVPNHIYDSPSSFGPKEDLVFQLSWFSNESVMVEIPPLKLFSNAFLHCLFSYSEAKYPGSIPDAPTTHATSLQL